jgi:hypothetical protein
MVDALRRPVPTTFERAQTEVVRSRSHLAAARESLELAVGIFRRLNGGGGVNPASLQLLESVIGDLEQAEAALRSPVG